MKEIRLSVKDDKSRELRNWFDNYVGSFYSSNHEIQQNIVLKKEHTLRVCKEITAIGRQLGLNDNELNIAEIIALLHDIGRFEQFARYNTFMDSKSENHALLGVEIINRYGLLNIFDDEIKEVVIKSVKYHNLAVLPAEESDVVLYFAKMIRDADKLDIWNLVIDYYTKNNYNDNEAIGLNLPDTKGFSENIVKDILSRKIVNMKKIKNLNDFKLLQVSWVMDINFDPTKEMIKERRYIDSIRNVLPESSLLDEVFDLANYVLQ